jgi:hypothetical protein
LHLYKYIVSLEFFECNTFKMILKIGMMIHTYSPRQLVDLIEPLPHKCESPSSNQDTHTHTHTHTHTQSHLNQDSLIIKFMKNIILTPSSLG